MTYHTWTPDEAALLARIYPDTSTADVAERLGFTVAQIRRKAYALGVHKTPEFLRAKLADAGRKSVESCRHKQFKQGHIPWNKGKSHPASGRAVETQFKIGSRPPGWRPIGAERVTKEGYLQRKMTDTGESWRDYVPVHHIVWFDAGREIPPGHALIFRDGDKRNFALENLELITRAELMNRNSYHNYGPEIAGLIQLRGVISRKLNRKETA